MGETKTVRIVFLLTVFFKVTKIFKRPNNESDDDQRIYLFKITVVESQKRKHSAMALKQFCKEIRLAQLAEIRVVSWPGLFASGWVQAEYGFKIGKLSGLIRA